MFEKRLAMRAYLWYHTRACADTHSIRKAVRCRGTRMPTGMNVYMKEGLDYGSGQNSQRTVHEARAARNERW